MDIVIIDNELELSQQAQRVLAPLGMNVRFASAPYELALLLDRNQTASVCIVNVNEGISASSISEQLRHAGFEGPVLVIADDPSDPRHADLARQPRTTMLPRPESATVLDAALRRFVTEGARAAERASSLPAPCVPSFHGIVGKSRQMLDIFARIEKVAASDASACVYGESGTGKELIARAIHQVSSRRDRPLITLDCTAIPEGLMESYLFGHVKGAFTGAIDQREGVFSLAHTGTLFMDELAELSLPLQAKLLRVVQDRQFYKVGGTRPITSDIRLITATNRDLKEAVKVGAFREDLYYRVAVVMLRVPPLRDRKEDIPLLVEYFLRKFSALYQKKIRDVAPASMDRLLSLSWPGNVRQLTNVIEQAVVLAEGDVLRDRDLFTEESPAPVAMLTGAMQLEPGLPLREVERRYILRTLASVLGSRTEAARILGISVRGLQYKLKEYGKNPLPMADSRSSTGASQHLLGRLG